MLVIALLPPLEVEMIAPEFEMVPPLLVREALPAIVKVTPESIVNVSPEISVNEFGRVHVLALLSKLPLITSHALLESPTCNS